MNDRKRGMYSLKEAAEAVGVVKPALLKAIQKGRISAVKNDIGQWIINPSELYRVYKPVSRETLPKNESERQEPGAVFLGERHEALNEVIELRLKLDSVSELKARIENECSDLRRRLDDTERARQRAEDSRDKAFFELSRLTLLLTDQKINKDNPIIDPEVTIEAQTPEKKGWFKRLFGRG